MLSGIFAETSSGLFMACSRPSGTLSGLSPPDFPIGQQPCVKEQDRGDRGKGAQGPVPQDRGFRSVSKGQQGGKTSPDAGKQ